MIYSLLDVLPVRIGKEKNNKEMGVDQHIPFDGRGGSL